MSHKKVLVIGMGRFGSALAEELWDTNCELLVVDKSPEAVDAHSRAPAPRSSPTPASQACSRTLGRATWTSPW